MDKLLPEWTPELLAFLVRRSGQFIEPSKSLNMMLAGAYMQGMHDAVEAMRRKENP